MNDKSGRDRDDKNKTEPTICTKRFCCEGDKGVGVGSFRSVGDIGEFGSVEVVLTLNLDDDELGDVTGLRE